MLIGGQLMRGAWQLRGQSVQLQHPTRSSRLVAIRRVDGVQIKHALAVGVGWHGWGMFHKCSM
jgi:hypothetical protein